ncbi:hypothetical protein [Longivirga aurantiaca]|uniref:Alpha/beta hydrolase n=1 Tax=Longivirga aurantiaca TaxID=1837743 RepID=A0ABW1SXW3_9ACTN
MRITPAVRICASVAVALLALTACSTGTEQTPAPTTSTPGGAPPPSPSGPSDAEAVQALAAPGPYEVAAADYALDDLAVEGLSSPLEVEAQVVGPVGATGPLPVVVLLHGYWASCWNPTTKDSSTAWPCPTGQEPIGNNRGFTYLQERLASHGFLTVSVSANGVNVLATDMGDDAGAAARSVLVRRHLDALANGAIGSLAQWPSLDLRSVLLMGHSRGGEGVDRAAWEGAGSSAWTVKGVVLVGPTAFEPSPRSTTAVVAISGDCDGDVGPSLGQAYVDRVADPGLLRSSLLVRGANHNYFNTEWDENVSVSGGGYDDVVTEGGTVDPMCKASSPTRLSPADQRETLARGMTLVASALLGGSDIAGRVLDASVDFPVTDGARVWVTPTGHGRTSAAPDASTRVTATDGATAFVCRGVSETEQPQDCGRGANQGLNPHWPNASDGTVGPSAVEISWTRAGGSVSIRPSTPIDLAGSTSLESRVAVGAEGSPVAFEVAITDTAGRSAELGVWGPIEAMPGGPVLPSRTWAQLLSLPLGDVPGVDLTRIATVTFRPMTESGRAWVLDLTTSPT